VQPPRDAVAPIAARNRLDYNKAHISHLGGEVVVPMSTPAEVDRQLEHLVFEIAKGVSGQTGEAFFHSLVVRLASALEADFVLVGALQPGGVFDAFHDRFAKPKRPMTSTRRSMAWLP